MYRTEIRMSRMTRKAVNFCVPAEPTLALGIRISINGVTTKVWQMLQLLCLHHILHGIFVKLNKPSVNVLRIVELYSAWGNSNLKSVNKLIYRVVMTKSRSELPWEITWSLLDLLVTMASSAQRIWFMRSTFILLENASKNQTTSAGSSNYLLCEVEWRKRPSIL